MKIVICPDSFKGSLSSLEAAKAIQAGFRPVFPAASFVVLPMADGGEGTVASLLFAKSGRKLFLQTTDPLGRTVKAGYGILKDGTAAVEMAAASGLTLLQPGERNPLVTSTFGTGVILRRLLETGKKRIIVGVGGSATVDAGAGMAKALGVKFLDKKGRELPEGGGSLRFLEKLTVSGMLPKPADCRITVLCDVRNPLTGRNGAARVFGPQKGAGPAAVKILEKGLERFAAVVRQQCGLDVNAAAGSGAAGGLAAGLRAFLDAELVEGSAFLAKEIRLSEHARNADLLITGEGRLDGQTQFGKTIVPVLREGKKNNLPVIAFCGQKTGDAKALRNLGLTAAFTTLSAVVPLEEAMKNAYENLRDTAGETARLLSSVLTF